MQAIRRDLIDITLMMGGKILKRADQIMDKTPLSPINNIVNVALKGVALIFAKMNPKLNNHPYFSHNIYVTHLKSKSFKRCFALMVPVLGFIAVALYDRVKNRSSAPKTSQPSPVAPVKAASIDPHQLTAAEKVKNRSDFSRTEFAESTTAAVPSQPSPVAPVKAASTPKQPTVNKHKPNSHEKVSVWSHVSEIEFAESITAVLNQPSPVAPVKAASIDPHQLTAAEKVKNWSDFSEEEQKALNAINNCHKKNYVTDFAELTIEDSFRKNSRLILAVMQDINENAVEFLAHEDLKKDSKFMLEAVKINPFAILHADVSLKTDLAFIKQALKNVDDDKKLEFFHYLLIDPLNNYEKTESANDAAFALQLIQLYPACSSYIHENLKKNEVFMSQVKEIKSNQ